MALEEAIRDVLDGVASIDLSDQRIGDAGIARLAEALLQSSCVEDLFLDSNDISDVGCVQLAQAIQGHSQSLKQISFFDNKISDVGATQLAALLQKCPTIRELDVRQNKIRDTGAVALAQAIESHSTLKHLWIRENVITDAGALRLVRALGASPVLRSLELEGNAITAPGVERLGELARSFGKSVTVGAQKAQELTEAQRRKLAAVAAAREWFEAGGAWQAARARAAMQGLWAQQLLGPAA